MKINKEISVLLASNRIKPFWIREYKSHLDLLYRTEVIDVDKILGHLQRNNYNVVIVDESSIIVDYSLIRKIEMLQPAIRVIIVTLTQDWHRARLAFQHGATDYIDISSNDDLLLMSIQEK